LFVATVCRDFAVMRQGRGKRFSYAWQLCHDLNREYSRTYIRENILLFAAQMNINFAATIAAYGNRHMRL
jgi:hypothetical protein